MTVGDKPQNGAAEVRLCLCEMNCELATLHISPLPQL